MPATPAVALVWPIIDLTEPTAHHCRRLGVLGEDGAERLDLGAVAGDGAGAVRLDQTDGRGREARLCVGAAQRAHLALGPRRCEAPVAAVARGADAADDGVDAVAVALGVGEALEHDRREALADRDPVGARIERAAASRR